MINEQIKNQFLHFTKSLGLCYFCKSKGLFVGRCEKHKGLKFCHKCGIKIDLIGQLICNSCIEKM